MGTLNPKEMPARRTSAPKQLTASTYIVIAIVGFILSLFCVYYYLNFIQGSVTKTVGQQMFYLILILFGIAASALIFGAMNSYGVLSGQHLDTKFNFAGPVVGVILVVMGGFMLPKGNTKEAIAVRIVNEHKAPVTNGKITLYFAHHTREESINNKGTAVFSDINEDDVSRKVKIDVISDGYTRLTFDTVLSNFSPIQLTLKTNWQINITGQVTDAMDRPIKDVIVMVEGSRFSGTTVNNGTYSIRLSDYSVGEEILLVTSHKDYNDKAKKITIAAQQMNNIDFVLQPLSPN